MGDIKEKGLSGEEVYDRATCRCVIIKTSIPHQSRNKMKRKKKIFLFLLHIKNGKINNNNKTLFIHRTTPGQLSRSRVCTRKPIL